MDQIEMRMELLKLAKGHASLPIEPEAMIKMARLLEDYVMGTLKTSEHGREGSSPR